MEKILFWKSRMSFQETKFKELILLILDVIIFLYSVFSICQTIIFGMKNPVVILVLMIVLVANLIVGIGYGNKNLEKLNKNSIQAGLFAAWLVSLAVWVAIILVRYLGFESVYSSIALKTFNIVIFSYTLLMSAFLIKAKVFSLTK